MQTWVEERGLYLSFLLLLGLLLAAPFAWRTHRTLVIIAAVLNLPTIYFGLLVLRAVLGAVFYGDT
jgi:hypothetical protein